MKTLKIVTGSMLLLCLGLVLVFYWGSRDEAEYQDLGLINDAHLDQQVQLAGLEFLLDRQFKVFQFAEGDSDKGEPLADSLQQSHLYKLLKPGYWARPAALAFRQQGEPYLPALLESLQASHWRFPPSPAPGISDYSIGGLMQLLDLLILETRWYLNEAKTSADIDKALDYYLAATELGLKLGESGDWTTDSLAVARYGLNKAELLLPELTPHLSTRQLRQLLANFEQQSPRLNQIYQQRFGYALVEYRRVLAFWRDEVEEQNPVAVFIARLLRPYHLHPKRSFNLYAKVLKQLQQYDYGACQANALEDLIVPPVSDNADWYRPNNMASWPMSKDYFVRSHYAYCYRELLGRAQVLRVALVAYERENGELPQHLAQLSPSYLSDLPNDVFSGKAFAYQRDKRWLYSIGADYRDGGGSEAGTYMGGCSQTDPCINQPTFPLWSSQAKPALIAPN